MTVEHYSWKNGPAQIKQHSIAKHQILRSYLNAYFQTLAPAGQPRDEFKLTLVDNRYSDADVRGILIGSKLDGIKVKYPNMTIISWKDAFLKARNQYITLLSALLANSMPSPEDDRVTSIKEFGGEEA